jgi:hypothetical protein
MQRELGWSDEILAEQVENAKLYVGSYGGPVPDKSSATLRNATFRDILDIFKAIDEDGSGFLDRTEVGHAGER